MAIVETQYGKVEGTSRNGIHSFKGIPFAAPPVGNRRWHPPEPPLPWLGVYRAKDWGKQAWQRVVDNAGMMSFVFNVRNAAYRDEDCLQLNVWTPSTAGAKRPVLLWIHGGGFSGGTAATPIYDGHLLAKRGDAVVVTANYRLGAFGFLHLSELTGGRIPASGNEGLLDQVQALKWVRDNIAAFGGDASNVTVFGESAGAMSVGALLAFAPAQGLFQRAMAISGAASTANTIEYAMEIAQGFLKQLGLSAKNDIDKLMALPAELLTNASTEYKPPGGGMTFQPCIDGAQLAELPLDAVRRGAADDVSVLVGTQRDEWRGFARMNPSTSNLDERGLIAQLSTSVDDPAAVIEGYRRIRAGRGAATDPVSLFAAIETDRKMRMPAIDLAEALAERGQSPYLYLFTGESPWDGGALGSPHAIIIGFVFGTHAFSAESASFFGKGEAADALSAHLQDAMCAFAKTGNPRTEALADWKAYDTRTRSTGIFGYPVEVANAPFDEERAVWADRTVSLPFGPTQIAE